MAAVEITYTVVDRLIERVGKIGAVAGTEVLALGPGVRNAEEQAPGEPTPQVCLERVIDGRATIGCLIDVGETFVRTKSIGRNALA